VSALDEEMRAAAQSRPGVVKAREVAAEAERAKQRKTASKA
jgi:hypothetical protein